ncbi:hypothetical protein [Methylorubrum aminovorans]|jgi:hypothetical protein|uniref:hypothetical protein n=1 Tax=Methylorubrum aminovorans TaxID=269069 RepID=UPI003C2CC4E5
MAKIKNDPSRYVRRSSLAGRPAACAGEKGDQANRKPERDFLVAPIGDDFYVDFRPQGRRGNT